MPAPRTAEVRVTADISNAVTKFAELGAAAGALTKRLESTDGRMANLVQSALALAPAIVPLGAAAVPAITGLSTQLGLAVVAAGTAALAFHGVGTALKAMDTYQAKPSITSLQNLQIAMRKLSPAGQDFVVTLDKLQPKLKALQGVAQAGMFPGLTASLGNLVKLTPQVSGIVGTVAQTLGDLAEAGTRGLAGSSTFHAFFDYIRTTARPVLTEMAQTLANFTTGIADLLMAFGPLSRSFSSGLVAASQAFAQWAGQLSKTKGFEDFVAYIKDNTGPALSALGSLANGLIEIIRAAAPVGHAVLPIITAFGNAVAAIASTNAGSALIGIAAAIAALGRSMALIKAAGFTTGGTFARIFDVSKISAARTAMLEYGAAARTATTDLRAFTLASEARAAGLAGGAKEIGKAGLALGGLALVASGLPDKLGLANTAAGALIGTIAGPEGAAIGGVVGLLVDLASASRKASYDQGALDAAAQSVADTLNQQTGAITNATRQAAAKELADKGVYDAAQKLGLGLGEVTSAYLGNADAGQQVGNQLGTIQAEYAVTGRTLSGPLRNAFDLVGAALTTQSGAFATTRRHIGQVNDALGGNDNALHANAGAQKSAGQAAAELMARYQAGTIAVNDFATAVDAFNAILDKRSDWRAYQAAIDDFRGALKKNGKTLDATTPKGRAMGAALDLIARQALNFAKTLKNADKRTSFLGHARKQFLDAAHAAGLLGPAAKDLANKLGLIKPPKKVKVSVDTSDAHHKLDVFDRRAAQTGKDHPKVTVTAQADNAHRTIDDIRKQLDDTGKKHPKPVIDAQDKASGIVNKAQGNINNLKGKTVDLNANNHISGAVSAAQASVNALHGKTIDIYTVRHSGKAHAAGGPIVGPGTGTSDSIPAWLSNGEYVMRTAAVQKYGVAMFDRINAMHFADGGPVRFNPNRAPITGDGGIAEVAMLAYELRSLRREVHGARDDSKKGRAQEVARATHELDVMKTYVQRVNQGRSDYAGTVRDALVSDPFGGTLGGFQSQVRYETGKLRGVQANLKTLRSRGLSGALLKDLAASGNTALIAQFAGLSRGELAAQETAYNRRNALDRSVGAQAAAAVYPSTTALQHQIHALTAEIHALRSGKAMATNVTNVHRATIRDSETKTKTKAAAAKTRRGRA